MDSKSISRKRVRVRFPSPVLRASDGKATETGGLLTTAQVIMRHSDPKLIGRVDTTRFRETEARAMDWLPDFNDPASEGDKTASA